MKRTPLIDTVARMYPEYEREQVMALVLCGDVRVDDEVVRDPKKPVTPSQTVVVSGRGFVSRGGEKLDAAIRAWGLPVEGKVFVDAGCSTGGFTDCLLSHGAARVHAVDVGSNVLAYRLRNDERVVVHERTNITTTGSLDPVPDAAVADLSFRSLRGVVPRLLALTRERWAVVLLKPQFEFGRSLPAGARSEQFDGVVRDSSDLVSIVVSTAGALSAEGVMIERIMPSPIRGRKGNIEFLCIVRPAEPREGSGDPRSRKDRSESVPSGFSDEISRMLRDRSALR